MRWRTGWQVLLSGGFILVANGQAQTAWDAHFKQGESLERSGKYAEASREFEAALSEAERLGPGDWRLPFTLSNLGVSYRELGKYPEAERSYRRAIGIFEANQPDRKTELAASLYNLGALNLVMGRLSRAESAYRRAYELRLAALGPADPSVGASLLGLAEVTHELRRYTEADDLYRRAAAILEPAYGSKSLAMADLLHNWGLLYGDAHRDSEALPMLERAEAIYEQAAPVHPKLAVILRNLAEMEAAAGNLDRAGKLFEHALAICDSSLPPGHPQTGIILQAYSKYLYQAKRKKEARVAAGQANAILMKSGRETGNAYTVDASSFGGR